jgi:hypothetical protein
MNNLHPIFRQLLAPFAPKDKTMPDWRVTVAYDPGVPKHYIVLHAPNALSAEQCVLRHIRYNPGVPIHSKPLYECPDRELAALTFEEILKFKPLNQTELEAIRYND